MWPSASPNQAFIERRNRFLERFEGPAVFGSGLARVRNFEANRFAYRSESHFLYFMGRSIEGALLCFNEGKSTLYAPKPDPADALWHGPRPTLAQLEELLGLEVRPISDFEEIQDVATLAPDDSESAMWLEELLGRAVDAGSASELEDYDLELAEVIIELRSTHDAHAIAQMEQAAKVTTWAHKAGMARTLGAPREAAVRAAMEAVITEHGMSCAYNSIVTVSGAVLHHEQSLAELTPGQLLLADVGAETPEGWASDVTRTWPVSGSFSPVQKSYYDAVLAAQHAALEILKPGIQFVEAHRAAARQLVDCLKDIGLLNGETDDLLADGAAAVFFPHGVGHLLGLDVHDMEDLGDRAGYEPGLERSEHGAERFLRLNRILLPNMVVTIEPGFYCIDAMLDDAELMAPLKQAIDTSKLAELRQEVSGIRIEDDVLITEDGYRVLTAGCPKTTEALEAAVQAKA